MMRRISNLAGSAGLLVLCACVPGAPGGPEPLPDGFTQPATPTGEGDTCGAAALSGLVGQPASAATAAGLSQPVRVVPLGGAMTMDLDPSRVNVFLDASGTIARLSCG